MFFLRLYEWFSVRIQFIKGLYSEIQALIKMYFEDLAQM